MMKNMKKLFCLVLAATHAAERDGRLRLEG